MRGKIVIVVMLGLAIGAAGFAWYQNYQRSARARTYWGDSAATIRFAKKVETFRIAADGKPADVTEISDAPGLLNARTSLMSDDAFDWSVEPSTLTPSGDWKYGVRFVAGDDVVTLLFSENSDLMLVGERSQAVRLDPKTAAGWRAYLSKSLARKEPQ
jgi:hypothetical protein